MDVRFQNAVQDFFSYFIKSVCGVFCFLLVGRCSSQGGFSTTRGQMQLSELISFSSADSLLGKFLTLSPGSRMINEWSRKFDSLLNESRMAMVFDQKEGLKLRIEGYQWAKVKKIGMEKMISINPTNKYTVSEAFKLGCQ